MTLTELFGWIGAVTTVLAFVTSIGFTWTKLSNRVSAVSAETTAIADDAKEIKEDIQTLFRLYDRTSKELTETSRKIDLHIQHCEDREK